MSTFQCVASWLRVPLAWLLCCAALLAHGGQYRGPGSPTGPGGPGGPAPATPDAGSPNTGAGASIPEEADWQMWWEVNKDEFVAAGAVARPTPITGSDDFYLGTRRSSVPVDVLLPTTADIDDRIVPALARLMEGDDNRDVQTACLMALGKIGRDAPGIELEALLRSRLSRGDQEVRETAVLALGASGRPSASPVLLSLLRDDREARRLAGRDKIDDRMRAFAAYGLGLLARRCGTVESRQATHDALLAIVNDKEEKSRDLLVAAVSGLGLLGAPGNSAAKRIAWQTVEELLEWYQRDLGRGHEAIQAQAPVAIGRLLGRGDSQLHRRCKQHFTEVLAEDRRSHAILRSAALVLGMLALPAEVQAEDAPVSRVLRTHYEKGVDRMARNFCVTALSRIGGAANREWLLKAFARGNRYTERPWLGMALGLVAARSAVAGKIDEDIARELLEEIKTTNKWEPQAAMVVALGMTRHVGSFAALRKLMRENEHERMLAGYYCIGLALLGDPAAVPVLSEVLEKAQRHPFLLQQAAVGLAMLGDRAANDRLLAKMKEAQSVAVLAALGNAIGRIGDRRAIDPLIEMTQDKELTKLARAFVAAALGGIGDMSSVPWNLPLSRDANYASPVDTLSNGSTGVLDIL